MLLPCLTAVYIGVWKFSTSATFKSQPAFAKYSMIFKYLPFTASGKKKYMSFKGQKHHTLYY